MTCSSRCWNPLVLALAGTFTLVAPQGRPVGPAPLDPPPPQYASWWQEAQACTGRRASMRSTHFWTALGFLNYPSETGLWSAPHDIYVLTVDRLDRNVVIHEMVHDLLQRGDHDSSCFTELDVG